MKIEEYISELLYEHDCVIVPDFGGFVCNYTSANIDPVKHLFEPPAKKILFNKGLTRNDGLLAHHISGKLKLPYSQALDSIAQEVKGYKDELQKDKRLTFENIGLLYIDEKGSLLFQQDNKVNYLADSFGLAAFYHLPAEQDKAENEGKVIPMHSVRRKVRTYAAAAVIGVLVTAGFYFTLLEKQTNVRFSTLNFFPKKEMIEYTPATYKALPPAVFQPLNIVAVSTKVSTPIPVTSGAYYSIIAGSFAQKENADNLISLFSKQNIHLTILGRTPQGLYTVGYGKYASHAEAETERDNFKKYIKDAWVKAN